jgi:hypothetical protein
MYYKFGVDTNFSNTLATIFSFILLLNILNMRKYYKERIKIMIAVTSLFLGELVYAQDIHFTLANAEITNDGTDDYFEVDVMIQTINSTGSFKLGSGQLYFNYNTAAFGPNIHGAEGFEVTQPNEDGYICGQPIDLVNVIPIYGPFNRNDNTTSRVSWAFSQNYSSSTFAADNVTDTPKKLCHLKFTFIDVNEAPNVTFEEGSSFDDQFTTACGPAGGPTESANCGTDPGLQLVNDTFDSSGASLSIKDLRLTTGLSLYPNPAKRTLYIDGNLNIIRTVEIHTLTGQKVKEVKNSFSKIDIESLQSAIYIVTLDTERGKQTLKLVVE